MRLKWIGHSIIVVLLCLLAFFSLARRDFALAAGNGNGKIETTLLEQITAGESVDFIIQFAEQADLSPAYAMDWEARGEYVYDTLKDSSAHSQVNAKAQLDTQGLSYRTFIAGNELYVFGTSQSPKGGLQAVNELTVLDQLAVLPEVRAIRSTRTYSIDPIVETRPFENITWVGDLLAKQALTTVIYSTSASLDWGISDTNANQFWTTFGRRGDGIVVANIDTGVQWNHPALDQAFKCGAIPSDPACWYDPSNVCGGSACDNQGHGTHTMGSMVGDDDPSLLYDVGMAPNAKWIACKGCESNTCSDFALNACADWLLAPANNPANRPNVVNNSWGSGYLANGDPWYLPKVNAWRAAGIFPAFSAGNDGTHGCDTLSSPGDYQESFASAAHDLSGNIASFSSRGPSAYGHNPYTKPNLTAPGVSIRSSYPTNTWATISGTSMASPHTAGAVALLWSCNPSLIGQIDITFQLLQDSAGSPTPAGNCGAPPDGQGNYTYGYGYLDVLAAGQGSCFIGVDAPTLDVTLPPNAVQSIPITLLNPTGNSIQWSIYEIPRSVNVIAGTPAGTPSAIPYPADVSLNSQSASGIHATPLQVEGSPSFILDDGSLDNNIGLNEVPPGYDYQFLWFNQFTPSPADLPFAINQIQIFFDGYKGVDTGDGIDLVVYQDADGDPTNGAVLLATFNTTIKAADGVNWSKYDLPSPVLITEPWDLYIGLINRYAKSGISLASQPATLDQSSINRRSWIGWWTTDPPDPAILPPNSTLSLIDDIQGVGGGNWMIRASGEALGVPWLSEDQVSGILLSGQSQIVNVTFNSTGLTPGRYLADLDIVTDNPDQGVIILPVSLGVPQIYLPLIKR